MFLVDTHTNDRVEAIDLKEVLDPFEQTISARMQAGEDTLDILSFSKVDLLFPSGEPLPRCWRDSQYRDDPVRRTAQSTG